MATSTKSLLVICDDADKKAHLFEAIDPLFPKAIYVESAKDAGFRLQNQHFPVILLNTVSPFFEKSDGLELLGSTSSGEKTSHWLLLNSGNENPENYGQFQSYVSEMPEKWKVKQLYDQLDEFYPVDGGHAPSKEDIQLAGSLLNNAILGFEQYSEQPLTKTKAFLIDESNAPKAPDGISALIELDSANSKGGLYFHYPNAISTQLSKGTDEKEVESYFLQLTDNISKHVSEQLKKSGHQFNVASKIVNSSIAIESRKRNHLNLCLPCNIEANELVIECGLRFKK